LSKAESQDSYEAENVAGRGTTVTPQMLVRKYASVVLGFCLANVKNLHDSEDIMQEVFLKAFTRLDTLRDPSRVRSWLLKIARRTCIDYYRERRPTQTISEEFTGRHDYGNEHIIHLHAAISKLPKHYRETISLYYLDGQKCAGVARSLGIKEAAVRRRLVRARLMLHELLMEDKS
jgi:RNA polymerase sigma-70 factor (ECF subfamily)